MQKIFTCRSSVHPSVDPSGRLSGRRMPVRLFVRPFIRPPVRLFVRPSISPSVRQFVRPSTVLHDIDIVPGTLETKSQCTTHLLDTSKVSTLFRINSLRCIDAAAAFQISAFQVLTTHTINISCHHQSSDVFLY